MKHMAKDTERLLLPFSQRKRRFSRRCIPRSMKLGRIGARHVTGSRRSSRQVSRGASVRFLFSGHSAQFAQSKRHVGGRTSRVCHRFASRREAMTGAQ
jgi:hypothetical protein